MAANLGNIGSIIRGDGEEISVTITEPDPVSPGQYRVRNITTDSFTFTAKRTINDATAYITKTVGSGITKTDPTNGELLITIDPVDFNTLTQPTTMQCDIQGVAASGRPYTTLFQLSIEMDVTR